MIVGFDIEIIGTIPEGMHWREVPDLGVSCAALSNASKDNGMLWYSAPGTNVITTETCANMLNMMHRLSRKYQIIAWNGTGFDFPFLAKMTGEWEMAKETALRCFDPCYAMLKLYGFPVGLDKTCTGFGVPGKPEGMDGLKAMGMWSRPLQRPKVLEYVIQDASSAAMLGKMISSTGEIHWETSSLSLSSRKMPWQPVGEYFKLPMPNTSWMKGPREPLVEKDFTWWMR